MPHPLRRAGRCCRPALIVFWIVLPIAGCQAVAPASPAATGCRSWDGCMGVGRSALARDAHRSATVAFARAESLAGSDARRAGALVALAEAEFQAGNFAAAEAVARRGEPLMIAGDDSAALRRLTDVWIEALLHQNRAGEALVLMSRQHRRGATGSLDAEP